jgi:hypothetical protein
MFITDKSLTYKLSFTINIVYVFLQVVPFLMLETPYFVRVGFIHYALPNVSITLTYNHYSCSVQASLKMIS